MHESSSTALSLSHSLLCVLIADLEVHYNFGSIVSLFLITRKNRATPGPCPQRPASVNSGLQAQQQQYYTSPTKTYNIAKFGRNRCCDSKQEEGNYKEVCFKPGFEIFLSSFHLKQLRSTKILKNTPSSFENLKARERSVLSPLKLSSTLKGTKCYP